METAQSPQRRIVIVIGLLIALGLPFCHLGDVGKAVSGLGPLFGGEVLWWALFILILAYTLAIERKPLSSIGFRKPRLTDIVFAVAFAVAGVAGIGLIFGLVLPALHLTLTQKLSAIYQAPFWFRVLLVTRAAFVEETAFRGYGFERIAELSGSKLLAALVTFALFTLGHYSGGGWAQVIIAAWGGVMLTVLYVWRRNVWASIVCHWLIDGAGFLLMPMTPGHH
ncbi:MAG: CPBP family intramembrane metalloprotease [Proteobacteria bacterium]|nr:CPBP family intramembrane metalloprotease [Pseudomonadota bacterium]